MRVTECDVLRRGRIGRRNEEYPNHLRLEVAHGPKFLPDEEGEVDEHSPALLTPEPDGDVHSRTIGPEPKLGHLLGFRERLVGQERLDFLPHPLGNEPVII